MPQPSTQDIKVYLVEDETLLRESLRAMLELEPNFLVAGVSADAEGAIRDLESLDVDVVLMDIRLPGINGIEAMRTLKEKRPELIFVVLTSYADEYLGPAIDAGASPPRKRKPRMRTASVTLSVSSWFTSPRARR